MHYLVSKVTLQVLFCETELNCLDTSNVFTELANTMKYGGGVLHNIIFTEYPFRRVPGDVTMVTAFHRIELVVSL